jgi:hypothetical protein
VVSEARRLVGSGIAYLFFGAFMLFMAACAWGIIEIEKAPKGIFMALVSTAIGIFDVVVGTRRLFSWGGACPYCGYSKVSLFRDVISVYCRACHKKIVRKGDRLYREEQGHS